MNIIDTVLLCWAAFLGLRGWMLGCARAMIGPIALILSLWMAWRSYEHNGNVLHAFTLAGVGPIFLSIAFGLLWKWANKKFNAENKPGVVSRLIGAGISSAWGCSFVLLCLIMFTSFPSPLPSISQAQNTVRQSQTYSLMEPALSTYLPNRPKANASQNNADEPLSPQTMQELAANPAVQKLLENPKMKALTDDPEIAEAIKNGQYTQLLSHPKFKELAQDQNLMKDVLKIYSSMFQTSPSESKTSNPNLQTTP